MELISIFLGNILWIIELIFFENGWVDRLDHSSQPLLRTGLANFPHPAPNKSVSTHMFSELEWYSFPNSPIRSSFVNHDFSISVYSHCFPFSLDLSVDPSLCTNYHASSLLWSTPTSIDSSQIACVYRTCLLGTSFKEDNGSPRFHTNLYILANACDSGGWYLLGFTRFTSRYLLLAVF